MQQETILLGGLGNTLTGDQEYLPGRPVGRCSGVPPTLRLARPGIAPGAREGNLPATRSTSLVSRSDAAVEYLPLSVRPISASRLEHGKLIRPATRISSLVSRSDAAVECLPLSVQPGPASRPELGKLIDRLPGVPPWFLGRTLQWSTSHSPSSPSQHRAWCMGS